jgi:hypothetical protein
LGAAGAMDELLLKYLQAHEVPTYITKINVAPIDLNYRKPGFNLLVGCRLPTVLQANAVPVPSACVVICLSACCPTSPICALRACRAGARRRQLRR